MKPLAVLLNALLLAAVIFLLIDNGLPTETHEQIIVILLLVAPIASLIALGPRKKSANQEPGLLSLYATRMRLEQQSKIDELANKKKI